MMNLEKYQNTWETFSPKKILDQAVETFGVENLTFACSFSAEDFLFLDLIQKHHPEVEVFTLDTGRLPEETYTVWQEAKEFYPKLQLEPFVPEAQELERFMKNHGPNPFYKTQELRKECCRIRKVEGLKKAIKFKKAWFTGLRSEQSLSRQKLKKIEQDSFFPDKYKINPIADVSLDEALEYARENNLPINSLYKKGYRSIGCGPCTRAVKTEEPERAGRWWWETEEDKKECGLHPEFYQKKEKEKQKKEITIQINNERLDRLENESIYILREAYKKIDNMGMLWSIGKDSCVMLHLLRKAFYGNAPIKLFHVDTSYKMPEMIEFRDYYAKKWNLNLIVHQNKKALKEGMNHKKGRLVCCGALKTTPLKQITEEHGIRALVAGIRRDEEGSRAKERYFSPRSKDSRWDYKNQPPEFWGQFQTEFPEDIHLRIHPILHWTEVDIWEYIKREKIPVVDLYFSKNGKRYRSLGCAPCTDPVDSDATTLDEIIHELRKTKVSERASRAQDRENAHAMQKLRKEGYM